MVVKSRAASSESLPIQTRRRDGTIFVLLAILAIAATLRGVGIGSRILAMDELWTIELSTGRGAVHLELPTNRIIPLPAMTSLGESAPRWFRVWNSLQRVTHPPLYFVILRLWRNAFGDGDIAPMMLSILASLGAVIFFYNGARRICSRRATALWAATLMAVAQPQVVHAQLVRNYAVLLFFGMLAWWALARIRQRDRRI